jgi:hypothetical protein
MRGLLIEREATDTVSLLKLERLVTTWSVTTLKYDFSGHELVSR